MTNGERLTQVVQHIIENGGYECDVPTDGFYMCYGKLLEWVGSKIDYEVSPDTMVKNLITTLRSTNIDAIVQEGRYSYIYYALPIKNIPTQEINGVPVVPLQIGVFQPYVQYEEVFKGESVLLIDVESLIIEAKNFKKHE